ncbi:MAG TPA: glycosyl hydrolase [Terriglobia bacterium]|nr:glycosyl hydrolase [Terriglobia bacterium]
MVPLAGQQFDSSLFSRTRWRMIEATAGAPKISHEPSGLAGLQRKFQNPLNDCRIMVRWWWFGPSATTAELEREMRQMKDAGIGGFEVQPVYPLALDDPGRGFQNYPYLSPKFLEALQFTSAKARELGLRMDLTLGSGWPYGGPGVPVTQAAGVLRVLAMPLPPAADRMPLPYIGEGEKLIAVFLEQGNPKTFNPEGGRELEDIHHGVVRLPGGLNGPHVLLVFTAGRTGQTVKRASLGAEGFVMDHYDRAAVENYLNTVGGPLVRAFGANPPYAIFCDSLEVYGSDWTGDFLREFRARRGYDLKPYLPELATGRGEKSAAVRHDWGETLTELFDERFVDQIEQWAREHHTLFRAQLYGTPPAILATNAGVDLPEGEGAHWKHFAPTRWASSANHLEGRPVTSSETWTWLHSPAFRATPLDFKAEADVHFLEGINQLVGHGWPYSPPAAGEPGWRFYASTALGPHNPWWLVMPDLARYLQRASFMLRQGQPVHDVAIYLPTDDAWAHFSPGKVSVSEAMDGLLGPHLIPALEAAGYAFDFIDDAAIKRLAKVEKGTLTVGGNPFRIVILPGVERIPIETLRKLEHFARQGGILVATRRTPSRAPGLMDADDQTREIRQTVARLFDGPSAPAHFVQDEGGELGKTLADLYQPDVVMSPSAPEIGFVHRRCEFAEIYFLANTGNQARSVQATFRVDGMRPEWWDPFSGKVKPAQELARSRGSTTVGMDLAPYGSRFLVFSNRQPASEAAVQPTRELPAPIDLSAGWKVTFDSTGQSVMMNRLRSWTDEDETRFYSGEATYEKTFTLPEDFMAHGMEVVLDFGEGKPIPEVRHKNPGMQAWLESPVREAAVVYVNGQRAGSVWRPPYEVEVTRLLRPGENTLRIVVGNLAINEMAGSTLPDYRLLNNRYGERFTPQDMGNLQPLPSGLLGTIRLVQRVARDQALPAGAHPL